MKKTIYVLVALLVFGGVSTKAQELKVDVNKSELNWLGKKVTGEHSGTIKIKSGTLSLKDGNLKSGEFTIDMTSLVNGDMDGDMKAKLEGHLKSDDFFGVKTYPTAKLVVKKATPFKDGVATIKADITIKGITHPNEFSVSKKGTGYTASITVDRSLYNVRYGSGKFFENLGDKTIYDDFTLDVKLVVE